MTVEPMSDAAWLLDAFNQLSYSNEQDRACRPEHYAEYEAERVRAAAIIERLAAAERERDALREALADIANTINIVGSPYDALHKAIDELVLGVKKRARAALTANHSAPVVEE